MTPEQLARTKAYQFQDKLYFRKGEKIPASQAAHEGMHGLDFLNDVPRATPSEIAASEWKAHIAERDYQLAIGEQPRLATLEDIARAIERYPELEGQVRINVKDGVFHGIEGEEDFGTTISDR